MPNAQGQPSPGDPDYVQPSESPAAVTPGGVTQGGIISTAGGFGVPVTGYTASQATATLPTSTGYKPVEYKTPAEANVQDQVLKIVAQDSPLMQQARANAMESANARGLINSTIAVGEGQKAVINQAMPMAQQNAGQEYQSMKSTTDAQNAAAAFEAQSKNTASLAGAQLATNTSIANAAAVNDALKNFSSAKNTTDLQTFLADLQAQTQRYLQELSSQTQLQVANIQSATSIQTANISASAQRDVAAINQQTQLGVAQLNTDTQRWLGQLDADNRQLLQTNINAASMFNQVVNNISQIQNNPNLDATAKGNAIQSQINMLNEALRTSQSVAGTPQNAIGNLNLGQFFGSPDVFSAQAPPGSPTSTAGTSVTLPNGMSVAPSLAQGEIDQTRLNLQRAMDAAQDAIPIWEEWDWRYASGVYNGGPNESERAAAWFSANQPQYVAAYNIAKQSYDDFNRLYPVSGSPAPAPSSGGGAVQTPAAPAAPVAPAAPAQSTNPYVQQGYQYTDVYPVSGETGAYYAFDGSGPYDYNNAIAYNKRLLGLA